MVDWVTIGIDDDVPDAAALITPVSDRSSPNEFPIA
jgi:hypothetical protein